MIVQGNPCRKCTSTRRYMKSNRCVECTKARSLKDYELKAERLGCLGKPRGRKPLPPHERKFDDRAAFTIRVSPLLRDEIGRYAKEEGRTLTSQIEQDLKSLYCIKN
jgi:hypothetical protein